MPFGRSFVHTYAWSSTNAASVSSTQMSLNGPSACGEPPGKSPWIAHSHQGSKTIKIPACQAQNTYLYYFNVDYGGGLAAGASIMVTVNPIASATALLTVNGRNGPVAAKVGDDLRFDWSSTGGSDR